MEEGWLYLAVVLELYSRRIIGWAIGERMTAALAQWRCGVVTYRRGYGGVVYSGWDSQYCSAVYQKLFKQHQVGLWHEQERRLTVTIMWQ